MSTYNWKKITVVPKSKDFIDTVLSKTQRKTPTEIHRQYPIAKIRAFYLRKVKFTQQTFHDKLTLIINEFPKLDNIHPFWHDVMDTLYDKDHYKLSLGSLNMARQTIDRIADEHKKLLKFADSLYRCKAVKTAALGRMVKMIKKQTEALNYLEEVRQHLARLPSIDLNMRTLVLCGFPNVGKSSFLNKITRADVDVQSYAFTTKSLFVGHTDYKYLTWQVIDTPGILDHPIESCNKIEMQTILALAHMKAAIIYVMDISEQCGKTLAQQKHLLDHNKPLFKDKPIIVCLNKIDVCSLEQLDTEQKEIISQLEQENYRVIPVSTLTDVGVTEVKSVACDLLLDMRVNARLEVSEASSKKLETNRFYISVPKVMRGEARPPCIPPAVLAARRLKEQGATPNASMTNIPQPKKKLERDLELEQGDDYILNLQKNWLLKKPEWKQDVIPELYEGHNIQDFLDPENLTRLTKILRQEEVREKAGYYDDDDWEDEEEEVTPGFSLKKVRKLAARIHEARKLRILESKERKVVEGPRLPRTAKKIRTTSVSQGMQNLGVSDINLTNAPNLERARSRSRNKAIKRHAVELDPVQVASRERSASRSRSKSGVRDDVMAAKVRKLTKAVQRPLIKYARKGEADRKIFDMKPKHLFSGKRGIGKTQRR